MLAWHATPEDTSRFAAWAVGKKGVNRDHFKEFRGLKLSSLGVGTYLGGLAPAERTMASGSCSFRSTSQ